VVRRRADVSALHGRVLGRRVALIPARDEAWRTVTPGSRATVRARTGSASRSTPCSSGATIASGDRRARARAGDARDRYVPQIHQVLPRVARLMVALREELLGHVPTSVVSVLVHGRGREGMGFTTR
jgi:hypothetical protein